jgi:hypothetical protein
MTALEQPRLGSDAGRAVRRLVNDEIQRIAARFVDGGDSTFEFLCECGDLSCRSAVQLTLAQYSTSTAGAVRAH